MYHCILYSIRSPYVFIAVNGNARVCFAEKETHVVFKISCSSRSVSALSFEVNTKIALLKGKI